MKHPFAGKNPWPGLALPAALTLSCFILSAGAQAVVDVDAGTILKNTAGHPVGLNINSMITTATHPEPRPPP